MAVWVLSRTLVRSLRDAANLLAAAGNSSRGG
jgi:hypothetical protein